MENPSQFEAVIRDLTVAHAGQYPRPFTTSLSNPLEAKGLILGYNQARTYGQSQLTHEEFLDYHFGRSGTSRDLYRRFNPEASPTRINIESLAKALPVPVLESDVYCYSSRKASDLSLEGRRIGVKLSQAVIAGLQPSFIIVFGANSGKAFPSELRSAKAIVTETRVSEQGLLKTWEVTLDRARLNAKYVGHFPCKIIFMPSLSLPEWNKWKSQYASVLGQIKEILSGI